MNYLDFGCFCSEIAKSENDSKVSHYCIVHLPFDKFECTECKGYIRSTHLPIHFSHHFKNFHPNITEPKENVNFRKIVPNCSIIENFGYYQENTVFANEILQGLPNPVSIEFKKWYICNKLVKNNC